MGVETWRVGVASLGAMMLVALAQIDMGAPHVGMILGGFALYAGVIALLIRLDGRARKRREEECAAARAIDEIHERAIGSDEGDPGAFTVPIGGKAIGDLKCWHTYFVEVWARRKPFELRKNDRDYRVGQVWCLKEYLPSDEGPDAGEFTGRWVKVLITSIVHGPSEWGLVAGSCVWGFWIIEMGVEPRGT